MGNLPRSLLVNLYNITVRRVNLARLALLLADEE